MSDGYELGNEHLFVPDEAPPNIPRKDIEKLIEEYIKNGGTITKLPCKYRRNSAIEDLKEEKKRKRRKKKIKEKL